MKPKPITDKIIIRGILLLLFLIVIILIIAISSEKTITGFTGMLIAMVAALIVVCPFFIQKLLSGLLAKTRAATDLTNLTNELEKRVQERTEDLLQSKNRLAETFERMADGFIALDKNWKYTYINERIRDITGLPTESLIGRNVWEVFPDAVGSATYQLFHTVMQEQCYAYNTDYFEPLDLWQENHVYPSSNGITVFIRDISEKKKAELKIIKANRLYFFISQVNQMIVRITDETTLFTEACRIAVELGGFRMAWIGMIDEAGRKVVPVMHAGEDRDYLSRIKIISLDDITEGRGPTATALKEGKHIVCNDIENDPQMAPWKEAAIGRGYLSSMSLPILKFGKVVGAFTFYANEKNFFDDAETELLKEATGDVAFALEIIEKERLRERVEQEIIKEKDLLDSIINGLPGIFYLYNKEGKFMRWNTNLERITHYTGKEIQHMNRLDFFDTDEKKLFSENINTIFITGEESVQANLLLKTKEKLPYYFTGKVINYEGIPCVMAVGIDFSERKKAQELIRQSSEQLRELAGHLISIREEERKRIGREIHDELGQQLTAIKMDVFWIEKKITQEDAALKAKLKNVITLLDGGNLSIKRILNELRPVILDDYGLLEALQWQGRQFTANTGIPLQFITTESQIKVPDEIATCLFRVYQEALTNITRHADASNVLILLKVSSNSIALTISDNGKGFDAKEVKKQKSFGILGIKERINSVNGYFDLDTAHAKGTKISINIPFIQQNH